MILSFTLLFAIRIPKGFTLKDYEQLAKKYHKIGQSVCLVYNISSGVQLTGVLIGHRTVLTAAHGFSPKHTCFKQSGWRVKFPNGTIATIIHIEVPKEYVAIIPNPSSQFGKTGYDKAICTLDSPVHHICPAAIATNTKLQDDDLLIVMTYQDQKLLAFQLPEFTSIHSAGATDTKGYTGKIYGSVFFNPDGPAHENNPFLEERGQRPSIARHYWQEYGKLPYAMALPGVSGSPVFKIDKNGCGQVIALVSGFTSIDKIFDIPYRNASYFAEHTSLKKLYDIYQTLFVLL